MKEREKTFKKEKLIQGKQQMEKKKKKMNEGKIE